VSSNNSLPNPGAVVALVYGGNPDKPVPFTYDRVTGTLDFDFSTGFTNNTTISRNTTMYIRGSSLSAIHNVRAIGPNIVDWLVTKGYADVGTVALYETPIVVRANLVAYGNGEPNDDNTMIESETPWNFNEASGDSTTEYFSTFLFKKPLIVTYTKTGTRKYRLFNTQFDGQT